MANNGIMGETLKSLPTGFWDWTVNFNIPVSNISHLSFERQGAINCNNNNGGP